ncbi:MAG: hypothetical protein QGH33_03265 [Pirellulaceae bacterium]|jgi:hypothetical protein|nr:hypothetical protein [Pirellulaceae bacterium]
MTPQVHADAKLSIDFQRTLRIPDDGDDYPLPPGLGRFPLRHVDDFADNVPDSWIEHGGVMLPMYQAEALWLNFDANYVEDRLVAYPFAVKIAAGKINAVTGDDWTEELGRDPQTYVVAPEQPWLDGYCVEKGFIRQFVAMPLGEGYTAEEQITGDGTFGGLQIAAYPMKREVFERRFPIRPKQERLRTMSCDLEELVAGAAPDMRQEIYDDPYDLSDWDTANGSRCFIYLTNSLVWRAMTVSVSTASPP